MTLGWKIDLDIRSEPRTKTGLEVGYAEMVPESIGADWLMQGETKMKKQEV